MGKKQGASRMKVRNWVSVAAKFRNSAGSMGDKRKEHSRRNCRNWEYENHKEEEMSYEGYVQYLCEDGHYGTVDAYADDGNEWRCRECGKPAVWRNSVDITNGSFYNEARIDGYVELEVEKEACMCVCECGNVHNSSPTIYKIPPLGIGQRVKS